MAALHHFTHQAFLYHYLMVYWSVYYCVAADTGKGNSIHRHLYLFRIEPISHLSVSV